MIVNFDKYIDNRHAKLSKFDGLRNLYGTSKDTCISMWVADMDFNPPQSVIKALERSITRSFRVLWKQQIFYQLYKNVDEK